MKINTTSQESRKCELKAMQIYCKLSQTLSKFGKSDIITTFTNNLENNYKPNEIEMNISSYTPLLLFHFHLQISYNIY